MLFIWPFNRTGIMSLGRWVLTLLGGVLMGMGLLLLSQAILLGYIKEEVNATFFVLRWVGKVSFIFMSVDNQLFLALSEIPDDSVLESGRWAKGLLILGGCLSMVGLFMRSPAKVKGKGKGKKGKK